MGFNRNGARSFLNIIAKACTLSHMPGWRSGLERILGLEKATLLLGVWDPFCATVDLLIAGDDFFNKKDHTDTDADGEDVEEL